MKVGGQGMVVQCFYNRANVRVLKNGHMHHHRGSFESLPMLTSQTVR